MKSINIKFKDEEILSMQTSQRYGRPNICTIEFLCDDKRLLKIMSFLHQRKSQLKERKFDSFRRLFKKKLNEVK
jgi:hypothetical protein